MSSDVRSLLHAAAMVPSIDANVAAAWRRGRRMRAQRVAVTGLAVVSIVAIAAIAAAGVRSNRDATPPAGTVTTTTALTCATPSTATNDAPAWTPYAHPPLGVPHMLSPDGKVFAVVFGDPLAAPPRTDKSNKILWIVRQQDVPKPLQITATLPGSKARPVRKSTSAGDGSYPTIVDVPVPGCWKFDLAWNGHRSTVHLRYESPGATTTSASVPGTTVTTVASTECDSAFLTVTLGQPSGAAGHVGFELEFRNHSQVTCTMTGYPGVSFLDGSGAQIGSPTNRNKIPYTPVTLQPGATAYALLVVTNPDVVNCPSTVPSKIRIFPPNETTPILIASLGGLRVCAAQTVPGYVNPVVDHSSN